MTQGGRCSHASESGFLLSLFARQLMRFLLIRGTLLAAAEPTTTVTVSFSVGPDGSILNADTGETLHEPPIEFVKRHLSASQGSVPHRKVVVEEPGVMTDNIYTGFVTDARGSVASGDAGAGYVAPGEGVTQKEAWGDWFMRMYRMGGKPKKPGHKSSFLQPVPMLLKFLMFWWCVLLLSLTTLICIDYSWLRYVRGGLETEWLVTYAFQLPEKDQWESASLKKALAELRAKVWSLLVDVPNWDPVKHPSLRFSNVVGEKKRLAEGVVMRLGIKSDDYTEEEKQDAMVVRKCVSLEEARTLTMETLNETASFTSISKSKIWIQLDDITKPEDLVSSAANAYSCSSTSNSSGTDAAGERTFRPHVRLTVAGRGVILSRIFMWWLQLRKQQEDNLVEYCQELEKCIESEPGLC